MSYLAKAAQAAFGTSKQGREWIDEQGECLLKSALKTVLCPIEDLPIADQLRDSIREYLSKNAYRMDYLAYPQRGLLIGSGAIESAHRTLVHKRLKRAGQPWTILGAQQVLNLRVCQMSQRGAPPGWNLIRNHIEPFQQQIAA
jgi:hypothetical protein